MKKRTAPLVIEGDMTIYSANALKGQLLEAIKASPELVLDLSQVSEFDSAGLQVLYLAKREAGAAGHAMRIHAHSQPVRELLELYNLAGYFGDPLLIPSRDHKSV